MNERSGFLTFVFILYLLGTLSHGANLINSILYLLLSVLVDNSFDNILSLVIGIRAIVFIFLIIYLIKVYGMKTDLKRWTDISHIMFIFSLLVNILIISYASTDLLSSTMGIDNAWAVIVLGYLMRFILGFFTVLSIFASIGFWLGIKSHLARLEREGKAKFEPGLFNREKPESQKK